MDQLTALANKHGSDKGDQRGARHCYTALYDFILRPFRQSPIRLLEIGLLRDGPELGNPINHQTSAPPSIKMWLEYFPNAKIIGFDICDFSEYETDRFQFFQGDSGDQDSLNLLIAQHGLFDIVIDDASHASFHQLKAFEIIFPTLSHGGIYIIEGLHWQPPIIERSLPKCPKTSLFTSWAMGLVDDSSIAIPTELEGLRTIKDLISFCHGFPGYRTGESDIKTAIFLRSDYLPPKSEIAPPDYIAYLNEKLDCIYNAKSINEIPTSESDPLLNGIYQATFREDNLLLESSFTRAINQFIAEKDWKRLSILSRVGFKRMSLRRIMLLKPSSQNEFIKISHAKHVEVCTFLSKQLPPSDVPANIVTSIEQAANSIAQAGCRRVILIMMTANYIENLELWMNCLRTTQKKTERILLLCLDKEPDQLRALVRESELDITIARLNANSLTRIGNGRSLCFIWYLKILATSILINNGLDVIYSDLDSFWIDDTAEMLRSIESRADLVFMTADDMPLISGIQLGTTASCGFFLAFARKQTQVFISKWLEATGRMLDDQIGLAQVLLENGIQWEQLNDTYISSTCIIPLNCDSSQATAALLKRDVATRTDRVANLSKLTFKPLIFHPRWILDKGVDRQIYLNELLQEPHNAVSRPAAEVDDRYHS